MRRTELFRETEFAKEGTKEKAVKNGPEKIAHKMALAWARSVAASAKRHGLGNL